MLSPSFIIFLGGGKSFHLNCAQLSETMINYIENLTLKFKISIIKFEKDIDIFRNVFYLVHISLIRKKKFSEFHTYFKHQFSLKRKGKKINQIY